MAIVLRTSSRTRTRCHRGVPRLALAASSLAAWLLLATLCGAAKLTTRFTAPSDGSVRIIRSGEPPLRVDWLLSSKSIVGARFVDERYSDQSVFGIFTLLGSLEHLQPTPRRALLVGLGSGATATRWRAAGIATDVVELSAGVVEAAEQLGFVRDRRTHVADAAVFLAARPPQAPEQRYDLIVHDVWSGSNAGRELFGRPLLARLRSEWLRPSGVLALNFVGYHSPSKSADAATAFKLSALVAANLRAVFERVRCYREVPLSHAANATNIVCVCSQRQWKLQVPEPTDPEVQSRPLHSDMIAARWQRWEVLTERELAEHRETCASDRDEREAMAPEAAEAEEAEAFAKSGAIVERELRETVEQLLPGI